jgi:putative ABC transport system substrate-binding protein
VARAQSRGQVWRIGVLETTSRELNAANLFAFQKGMRELGYVGGQNLLLDYRSADGRAERFPSLAAELVDLKVDVIVTRGAAASLAAKQATATIPIVMAAHGDPLSSGLIASLARPGGNITGLSTLALDLYPKRVELLRDMIPTLRRISGVFNKENPLMLREWEEVVKSARSLGITADLMEVRNRDGLASAFDAASARRVEAVMVGTETVTESNKELVVELAVGHRIPTMYSSREFVDAGGLLAYGISYPDLYYRAAAYVDKILKGARAGDLPVQQPTKFELVINLRAANAIALTIPESFLTRADEVIE